MNILTTEQMKQTESYLLKQNLSQSFQIKLPKSHQYDQINIHNSTIFTTPTKPIQEMITKKVSLTGNVKVLPDTDSNSIFKMLMYSFMTILYQDKSRSTSILGNDNGAYLLDNIKCSLFSKDMNFMVIKDVGESVHNEQCKIMFAKFLHFMDQIKKSLTVNRMNYVQWIIQKNPKLVTIFSLFLRFVLLRFQNQDAQNYKKKLNSTQVIQNLIEYFDLNCRVLGDLILFNEDGLFMIIVKTEFIFGEYYTNQAEKQNQQNQLTIKESIKMNMIESLLVQELPQKDKKSVVESDVKKFNFILDNQMEKSISFDDKEAQQTPKFKDTVELNFGKRKKSFRVDEKESVKMQILKLIGSDDQCQEEEEHLNQDNEAPTPFLGDSALQFSKKPSGKKENPQNDIINEACQLFQEQRFSHHALDSPIECLTGSFVFQNNNHHMVSQGNTPKNQGIFKKVSFDEDPDNNFTKKCGCFEEKYNKNTISNTVSFVFNPKTRLSTGGNEQQRKYKREAPKFLKDKQLFKKAQRIDSQQSPKQTFTEMKSIPPQRNNASRFSNIFSSKINDHKSRPKIQNVEEDDNKSCYQFNNQKYQPPPIQNNKFKCSNVSSTSQTRGSNQKNQEYTNFGNDKGKYKFFAPVQIIAPTVYVNSNTNSNNNFVFKMNESNKKRPDHNPDQNTNFRSQTYTNNRPQFPTSYGLTMNKSEKVVKYTTGSKF